jgi:hypothetical protein
MGRGRAKRGCYSSGALRSATMMLTVRAVLVPGTESYGGTNVTNGSQQNERVKHQIEGLRQHVR